MHRRTVLAQLLAIGATAIATRTQARGGRVARLPAIGFLLPGHRPTPEQLAQSPIRARLRELGWIDGQTVSFEPVYAEGNEGRLPDLAVELVRKGVDVIWVTGPEGAVAAARATQTIPIVFWGVAWPIEMGLIDSLARPGRNVTGLAFIAGPEVYGKPLEFLRQVAPTRSAWR